MISVTFARNYAYLYWGSIGALLAFVIPMDPTIVGPKSALGPLLEMFPDESLDETAVWLGHAWGVTMLSMIAANYLSPGTDQIFVKMLAILSAFYLPVCYHAWSQNFGFFWTYFFPVVPVWNTYVYASASGLLSGKSVVKKA